MNRAPVRWLFNFPKTGRVEFRLGRSGDEVLAEWVGQATLRANIAGTRSELAVENGLDRSAIEDVLRAKVDACLRHLQGGVSLHASSVAWRGIALAILGDSSAGKSTLAAQLCANPEIEFVSDDLTSLQFERPRVEVAPTDTAHLLREDAARAFGMEPAATMKTRKRAARAAARAAQLGALVTLVFDDNAKAPVLRRIRGLGPFFALNRALFRFVLDDPDILRGEMDKLARVAEQAPLYELVRSRDLSNLPASAHEVTELLRSLSQPTEP
jgi:hypothetical protein